MDITQLFAPTLLFALACYFAALATRMVFQRSRPSLKGNFVWENFYLPAFPVVYGMLFALVPKYPIPAVFIASVWSKVFFGGMAGTLSSWVYKIAKAGVKKIFGVDVDARTMPPSGGVPGTDIDVPPPPLLPPDEPTSPNLPPPPDLPPEAS